MTNPTFPVLLPNAIRYPWSSSNCKDVTSCSFKLKTQLPKKNISVLLAIKEINWYLIIIFRRNSWNINSANRRPFPHIKALNRTILTTTSDKPMDLTVSTKKIEKLTIPDIHVNWKTCKVNKEWLPSCNCIYCRRLGWKSSKETSLQEVHIKCANKYLI